MSSVTYSKDADARLDYIFDWSKWLAVGETITSASISVESGDVTLDSSSHTSTSATAWVSGGTKGFARVVCHIVTNAGREDDRTIRLQVLDR